MLMVDSMYISQKGIQAEKHKNVIMTQGQSNLKTVRQILEIFHKQNLLQHWKKLVCMNETL